MQLATSSWCRGVRFFGAFFVALSATRVGRIVCLGSFGYWDNSTRARVREVARGLGVSRG